MAKQVKTLKCGKCKENKPTSDFAKSNLRKSGYQCYCRECKKQYQDPYMKADKDAIFYKITNPLGHVYIGCSKRKFKVRINAHKSVWNADNGRYPLLHQSFDTWGFDTHLFEIITTSSNITKKQMHEIERNMIKALRENSNVKLLNVM